MPRFVLLYHDCPLDFKRPSHWDLMLEDGDMLRTWALERLPEAWQQAFARTVAAYPNCPAIVAGNDVAVEQLGDHRRDYLEFEGDVSGGRGCVTRVAAGTYLAERETPTEWQIQLAGDSMSGRITLGQRTLSFDS